VGLDTELFYKLDACNNFSYNTDNVKDPLLLEILGRSDCPVKFIFISYGTKKYIYMYSSQYYTGEYNAYLLAKYDVESLLKRQKGWQNADFTQAYIDGKIFSYPEVDIRAYLGPNWEQAKIIGEQWLSTNQHKTLDQLKLETWQLIQEYETRNLIK
jgi:hypothetical protein